MPQARRTPSARDARAQPRGWPATWLAYGVTSALSRPLGKRPSTWSTSAPTFGPEHRPRASPAGTPGNGGQRLAAGGPARDRGPAACVAGYRYRVAEALAGQLGGQDLGDWPGGQRPAAAQQQRVRRAG